MTCHKSQITNHLRECSGPLDLLDEDGASEGATTHVPRSDIHSAAQRPWFHGFSVTGHGGHQGKAIVAGSFASYLFESERGPPFREPYVCACLRHESKIELAFNILHETRRARRVEGLEASPN